MRLQCFGAANRIWTGDLFLTKEVLYLLSHSSNCYLFKNANRFNRFTFDNLGAGDRTWTGTVLPPRDFKSLASANFATSAGDGGATQIRTGGKGFADPCLTTWLWRPAIKLPLIKKWSGKRDSNSRHLPWQGNALPLSHSRIKYRWLAIGGNNRARTYDPLLVRQMLSQLSYAPELPSLLYYTKFTAKKQVIWITFFNFLIIFFD